MEMLVYSLVGVSIGIYIMYTHLRITLLSKKIEAVADGVPTAESLAKEILAIKMPLSDLPKETVDMINKETNRKDSYFG